MKILQVTEHEDGSCSLQVDLSEAETSLLIEKALVDLIKEFTNEQSKTNLGNPERGGPSSVHGTGEQPSQPGQPLYGPWSNTLPR